MTMTMTILQPPRPALVAPQGGLDRAFPAPFTDDILPLALLVACHPAPCEGPMTRVTRCLFFK